MKIPTIALALSLLLLAVATAGCAEEKLPSTVQVRCHVPPSSYAYLRADVRLSGNVTALNELCERAYGRGAHLHSES